MKITNTTEAMLIMERAKCLGIYSSYMPEEEILDHQTDMALIELYIEKGDAPSLEEVLESYNNRVTEWRNRRDHFLNAVKTGELT